MSSPKKGGMFILSSPSGAGKTTLVKKISKNKNFSVSISHTTRTPRPNEKDGKDYFLTDYIIEGEGHFGGFFGWPNLTLTPAGGFMGMPASETPGDMRVIDMYRREGEKLTENWVFIDLLHFWKMQGIDILNDSLV